MFTHSKHAIFATPSKLKQSLPIQIGGTYAHEKDIAAMRASIILRVLCACKNGEFNSLFAEYCPIQPSDISYKPN